MHAPRSPRLFVGLSLLALATTACTAVPTTPAAAPTARPTASASVGSGSREVATLTPRVLLAREGGLTLLDAATGAVVEEVDRPGFLRLNEAGDGRHVLVTEGDRFLVYDTGIRSRAHGDHSHHYTSVPGLTGQVYDSPRAGHVTAHHGWTTLFSDGTGSIVSVPSDKIADPGTLARTARAKEAHHGVAVLLADDALLLTQGTATERKTVQVVRGEQVLAQADACPGTHGEATAKPTASGDVVLVGCTDGPVVYRDGQ